MRLLLDTCTFLWLIAEPASLSPPAREAIAEPRNACYLSAVSLWEILVKHALGRLEIAAEGGDGVAGFLLAQREAHRIDPLPLEEAAVARLGSLPDHHRDPFDRMLACQALAHGLRIVTPDPVLARYPVPTLW